MITYPFVEINNKPILLKVPSLQGENFIEPFNICVIPLYLSTIITPSSKGSKIRGIYIEALIVLFQRVLYRNGYILPYKGAYFINFNAIVYPLLNEMKLSQLNKLLLK